MTTDAQKLLDQALGLPDEERLAIASALLESVEGDDLEWDEAWAEECRRRSAAARASGKPLAEWSEVRERMLRRLGEMRGQ